MAEFCAFFFKEQTTSAQGLYAFWSYQIDLHLMSETEPASEIKEYLLSNRIWTNTNEHLA